METLFRGFHKQADGPEAALINGVIERGRWVKGDLRQDKDLETKYISGWNYYAGESGVEREPFEYEVAPVTVGQWTGLTDKNGKKIFQGDRVQCRSFRWCGNKNEEFLMRGTIEFDHAAFHVTWDDATYGRCFSGYVGQPLEIIGTIYDASPEGAHHELV